MLDRVDNPDAVAALLRRLDLGVPSGALLLTELLVPLSRGELLAPWHAGLREAGKWPRRRRRLWNERSDAPLSD